MLKLFKKKFISFIYILFLGAASSYSLPPYNSFIINFITFFLLFTFLFNKKKNFSKNISFFKYGWFFGFGYFLSSLYWTVISLTFDETFIFLIPFALILVPAFLSIFYGLVSYLFAVFFSNNVASSFLIFSILFGIIEFVRGFILTGFPWNLISFSFSNNTNFIQILSIIGTYSFNLICISLFTIPALLFLRNSKREIILSFFFILTSIVFLFFGHLKNDKFNSLEAIKNPYTIRALSPKIDLERFYSKSDELKVINELIKLSNPQKKNPTIFLWPEGIIPDIYLKDISAHKELFLNRFGNDDVIIMGLNSVEKKNDKNLYFNTLAVFDNKLNLKHRYNKVNLVPFGEFIPFENVLSLIGFKTITNEYQSFSRGGSRKPFDVKNDKIDITLLPLICYEIIYSGKLTNDKDFNYIINISEDGWFGNSIGPKQHFEHSIFRSIESGKYIIRSANNGISAVINPVGIVEKEVKLGSIGYIDFSESKSTKPTPFLLYGNKIFVILILLYIFLFFSFNKPTNE